MLEISRYVFNNTDGVNHYNPGSGYLNYVRYEIDNFPMSRYDYESPNILWDYYDPNSGTNYTFDSIEKYVEFGQSRNLTHIVTNGHNADPDILNDLFFNENNYPYVEKQFDSFDVQQYVASDMRKTGSTGSTACVIFLEAVSIFC